MQVSALELRPGTLVRYEGRMCTVVWWNILRNDRRAFVQLRIKDLQSGRVQELKEHTDSKWEVLDKEERDLSHSYRDGIDEVFFTETGDEVRCAVAAAAGDHAPGALQVGAVGLAGGQADVAGVRGQRGISAI